MELHNNIRTYHPKTRKDWRKWLEKNHAKDEPVWLIIYHKSSGTPTVYYEEAVEEALCFGWIDSVAHKRDPTSKYQFFTKRKPKSNWSRVNRERAERMTKLGLIRESGQKMIDLAKKTGTWDSMKHIDELVVPDDLAKALAKSKTASKHFGAFSRSSKKIILTWIHSAKRPETRKKRIEETVMLAAKNVKANHYQPKAKI